jgi:hypothetical protein
MAISCPDGGMRNNGLKLGADLVVVDPMLGVGDDTLALNARHDLFHTRTFQICMRE